MQWLLGGVAGAVVSVVRSHHVQQSNPCVVLSTTPALRAGYLLSDGKRSKRMHLHVDVSYIMYTSADSCDTVQTDHALRDR